MNLLKSFGKKELIFEVEVNLSVCTMKWVEVEKEVRREMGGEGGEKEEGRRRGIIRKRRRRIFFPISLLLLTKQVKITCH